MGRPAIPLPVPLEDQHRTIAEALNSIMDGASLIEIAEGIGMKADRLRLWLLSDVPEQYRAAQERGLVQRVIDCDNGLERASSHLEVAKRAHMAKFARWDAERRGSRLFALKAEVSGRDGAPLVDASEIARRLAYLMATGPGATLEGESTREPEPESESVSVSDPD